METIVQSGGLELPAFLARPQSPSAGALAVRRGLVICTGLPGGNRTQVEPELAQRLATEAGWWVLTFDYRAVGEAAGAFSLGGWVDDVRAAVDHLVSHTPVTGVWLAGFELGGSLAICEAAEDDRIKGVAALGALAEFTDWQARPDAFIERATRLGLIADDDGFDRALLLRDLKEIQPLVGIGKIRPRPVLVVHGSSDAVVPLLDARLLVDAAESAAEFRVVPAAGHALRHDPRAVAVLLGWMDRQGT